jgi:hypothetical protein
MNLCKPLLAALALAWSIAPAAAQTHRDPANPNTGTVIVGVAPLWKYTPLGHQVLTSGALASATNINPPLGATIAQICVETASVRYWDDGSVPTTTSGMPVVASSTAPVCWQYAGALSAIQFIAASGSPQIDLIYYYAP